MVSRIHVFSTYKKTWYPEWRARQNGQSGQNGQNGRNDEKTLFYPHGPQFSKYTRRIETKRAHIQKYSISKHSMLLNMSSYAYHSLHDSEVHNNWYKN